MNETPKDIAALSAAPILTALAELMLEEGVSYAEFAAIARHAFVNAAEQVLASEKRVTDSRVSILTGIHRKEVKQIRGSEGLAINPEKAKSNRAIAVISAWTREAAYLSAEGQPLPLPYDGPLPSLTELIQSFSGDMPVRAVCDELTRMGVIEQRGELWYLLVPVYVPNESRTAVMNILSTDTTDLIRTIHHNLNSPTGSKRFQRTVSYDEVSPESAALFKEMASGQSLELLKQFDAWLAKREKDDKASRASDPSVPQLRAGVGIYYFEQVLTDKSDQE